MSVEVHVAVGEEFPPKLFEWRATNLQHSFRPAIEWSMGVLLVLLGSATAIVVLIRPMFGYYTPESVGFDFENQIALVAGALETWRTTHALPISSNQLVPGVEYPYFLFGNSGFYVVASFISFVLNAPASVGAAWTLSLGLVLGQVGTYLLARSFGLNRIYSAVLGFLYATGPYLSVNLLVRVDFPEFLAWESLPLLCFVGRRAVRPGAPFVWLAGLVALMSLPLYLHKLVGPHIILFAFALILTNARRTLAWWVRFVVLGASVPCVTVFAWAPILRLPRNQIVTLQQGAEGLVYVFNNSLQNYLWPWAQNSLPSMLDEPPYGHRFALQIGVLATIGILYGTWCLLKTRFRPKHPELYVALIGAIVYSLLVLNIGGLSADLPFPFNTIQFSYRLLGLAFFSGVLALIISLAEATAIQPDSRPGTGLHVIAAVVGAIVVASCATYWRSPVLKQLPEASIQPVDLRDASAFYSKSFKSLFDVSGSIRPDGTLVPSPFLIGLRGGLERVPPAAASLLPNQAREQLPRTVFLRGQLQAGYFTPDEPDIIVRVYAVRGASDPPCASELDLPKELPDLITQLLAGCIAAGKQPQDASILLAGNPRAAKLLADQTFDAPGPIDLRVSVPEGYSFIALECAPKVALGRVPVIRATDATCLTVEYLGPANQPDDTIRAPRVIASDAVTRWPFGKASIRFTNQPPGDYKIPTFDYPFVRITGQDGAEVPEYQFDRQPVIRFDGTPQTFSVGYDLSMESTLFSLWAYLAAGVLVLYLLFRRVRAI